EAKSIVETIQQEIKASKGTRIWSDYINALKLIAQVVFTRSSGFILELLQNAEDAGLGLETPGVFEVRINHHRAKIIHNGRPFDDNDVKALCGIRSSKKPEKGTLGYLGIGFKSVFKVTDCPEIYSAGFQFKFDRNHKEWDDPSNTPWHVLPIWIDQPSEPVDHENTTFIIPFREETYYSTLLQEVARLGTELYLFLRWLKRIEIADEVYGRTWTLENVGQSKDGVTTLRHNGNEQRFKFFRRVCPVPGWVKEDRLTQEYRANVTHREIAIAFALDDKDNLSPIQAGAMYGGLYSFLPLGEARSGAKFPIQADFLVQPGREAINYEAKWNHWLVEQAAELCKEAIYCFKVHHKWKYQFLPAFEFTKSRGVEAHDRLFGPKLIEPVESFLREDACVPTAEGGWAKPGEVIKLNEDQKAIDDLVNMGLLDKGEIAVAFGGQPDSKLVAPEVVEPYPYPFKKVDRMDLLGNEPFLDRKRKSPNPADWFRRLYLWLQAHPRRREGYWYSKIVFTSEEELLEGRHVWLPDFQPSDPILKDVTETLQKSKPVVHPDILAKAKSEEDRKTIRGFLTGLTGVQLLDSKTVCKEALLPKILTTAPKPVPEDLLICTTHCQEILGEEVPRGLEFWVLTKQGDVKAAKEVFFPKEFKPEEDWETHQQYVPGTSFISQEYIEGITSDEQLRAWRKFFKMGGIKDAPVNGVEVFAENYVEKKLKDKGYTNVVRVDKMKFGYDMQAKTPFGEPIHIEVKGQSHDQEVELKGNEVDAADTYKDSFYLCVVSGIPENPAIHPLKNPTVVGKKEKLTIPVDIWKALTW
ncbi:DUF3883 domain-containing protein, partial [Dehalococcoidia bacterium]|nr:DUF3883 domain-containing protein [Dehalococcoidia bacterium]